MPHMKPTETTFDPNAVDSSLAALSKMPQAICVSLSEKVETFGTATVDGVRLTGCEQVKNALGAWKLLVPVGQVAYENDRTYTVKLEGFRGRFSRKFPTCTFQISTVARKYPDETYAEHDEQALQAAREGMVLLQNHGQVLPLQRGSVLNCFGDGQHMYRITATGASKINPRWAPNFAQAVADHSDFTINQELASFYRVGNGIPSEEMLNRAKERSDTAVIFITRHSGESQDNRPIPGQYYLTEEERSMIRAVTAVFDKTVAILNVGYPIEMPWIKEMGIDSVLYTGFAGMLSAYALVEILDGRVSPSGCLADTWSWDYFDHPVSKNQPLLPLGELTPKDNAFGVRIYYEEDIYVGYRYYDTFKKDVAYPFGHGLSYTEFAMKVENFRHQERGVTLDVMVTNTGTMPGKKVVQLYASAPDGKLEKPEHVLVDFEKTDLLQPGQSQTLHMVAENRSMASFCEESSAYLLEKGTYQLSIGYIGKLQIAGSFCLEEDQILRHVQHCGAPVEQLELLSKKNAHVSGQRSCIVPMHKRFAKKAKRTAYRPQRLHRHSRKRITWDDLKKDGNLLDDFVAQMNLAELAQLNVCAGGQWGEGQIGCCGYTYAMKKYGLPSFYVSDANAGIGIFKPNIGFPASSVIASTFNKQMAYTVGRVIAQESLENGIYLNLGPGMNMHRNMLCGRHPEYFSEDPYLTGTMAGYHGKGLEENGVGCCYKHLFCNGSDLSRCGSHSIVPERALRELYYYCFERAFAIQKPSAVMTSYNAMNGLYPAENAEILQGLVRQEWGFEGFIMSDWNSYHTVNAIEMVNAGNGWLTLGGMFWVWVVRLAAFAGLIRREVLEHNVRYQVKILLEKHKEK